MPHPRFGRMSIQPNKDKMLDMDRKVCRIILWKFKSYTPTKPYHNQEVTSIYLYQWNVHR